MASYPYQGLKLPRKHDYSAEIYSAKNRGKYKTIVLPESFMSIWILKGDGQKENFNPAKVKYAMRRSGLSLKESEDALKKLRPQLYNGIDTKKIYKLVYGIIDEMRPEVSHRYNLKRALHGIGPAGHEFEDFTATLLGLEGYSTKVRQIMQGKCVSHEIDVVARKGKENYMIECKFRNQPGDKCRIQTALYVYARFLDLQAGAKRGTCEKVTKPWLVTNAKFSREVMSYSECMGMELLGWKYPLKNGLEIRIDKSKCYPVSVIKMSEAVLRQLLNKKIVTVYDLPESAQTLAAKTGISLRKAKDIVQRAEHAR
jgi:Holliday junction resolvase